MRYAVGRWAPERWDRETQRIFAVAGRSTTDASAAADDFSCNLWNPSGTRSLWVVEFNWENPFLTSNVTFELCRTSTAGTTPTTTVTPDLDNDFEREITPNTGAVLYLGPFATDPTKVLPNVDRIRFAGTGSGLVHAVGFNWLKHGLRVPPGSGLGLSQTTAVAVQAADFGFRFWE